MITDIDNELGIYQYFLLEGFLGWAALPSLGLGYVSTYMLEC